MEELTNKQKYTLEVIIILTKLKGYPPTVREIGKKIHVNSSATVYYHLQELKKKNYITWEQGQNRTIKVIK